jgi:precorrin-8X/cobalt-precorrin-8 methylmutase
MQQNTVTEQMTQAGQKIEHDSFAIVDQEVGSHNYSASEWNIVRRMIHATADFEFNGLSRFHPDAVPAGLNAISQGANIVADVEMICVGLSKPRLSHQQRCCFPASLSAVLYALPVLHGCYFRLLPE